MSWIIWMSTQFPNIHSILNQQTGRPYCHSNRSERSDSHVTIQPPPKICSKYFSKLPQQRFSSGLLLFTFFFAARELYLPSRNVASFLWVQQLSAGFSFACESCNGAFHVITRNWLLLRGWRQKERKKKR